MFHCRVQCIYSKMAGGKIETYQNKAKNLYTLCTGTGQ